MEVRKIRNDILQNLIVHIFGYFMLTMKPKKLGKRENAAICKTELFVTESIAISLQRGEMS